MTLLVLVSPIVANAGWATRWCDTNIPTHRCLHHAQETAQDAGFTMTDQNGESAMFNKGPYQLCVRCVPEHNIVFFYSSGPDGNECKETLDFMQNNGRWIRQW